MGLSTAGAKHILTGVCRLLRKNWRNCNELRCNTEKRLRTEIWRIAEQLAGIFLREYCSARRGAESSAERRQKNAGIFEETGMSVNIRKNSEKFLEEKEFVLHEYQPHRKISVFRRQVGEIIIFKSVNKNGDIVDGNLLDGKS